MLFLEPYLLSQVLPIASDNLLGVIADLFEHGVFIRLINPLTSILRSFIVSQINVWWLFVKVHLAKGATRTDAALRTLMLPDCPATEVMVDCVVDILQPGRSSVD